MHTHAHTYTHAYTHTHIRTHTHTLRNVLCTYTRTHVHIHTQERSVHTYTRTHVHIHTLRNVLENFHVSTAFRLLSKPQYRLLGCFGDEGYTLLRRLMVSY